MNKTVWSRAICFLVLASIVFSYSPKVNAQVGAVSEVISVPVIDRQIGYDALSMGVNTTINTLSNACEATKAAVIAAETGKEAATSGPSTWLQVIGGAAVEAAAATAVLKVLKPHQACLEASLTTLKNTPALNLSASQTIQTLITNFSAEKSALDNKVKQLEVVASTGWKDVAKAVMIKSILNVTKNVTATMANKMLDKYKISDVLKYTDAVASQVYNMKYINENYAGDQKTQMALRALVTGDNPLAANAIVRQVAGEGAAKFLNDACAKTAMNPNDAAASMNCLASYGNLNSNPLVQQMRTEFKAGQVQAAGRAAAEQEVAQSQGFAPARDCSGAVSTQTAIDSAWQTAAVQAKADTAVLNRLEEAYKNGQTTQEEVSKARTVSIASLKAWNSLSSDGMTSVIVDVCEAISSPGAFIAKNLENFIVKHLDQAYALRSENLPFMYSFLGGVMENFFTNLILGGKEKGNKSQVLKEGGLSQLTGGKVTEAQTTYGNSQASYETSQIETKSFEEGESSMTKGEPVNGGGQSSTGGGVTRSEAPAAPSPIPAGLPPEESPASPPIGSSGFSFR